MLNIFLHHTFIINTIFSETNILLKSNCVLPFPYSLHLVLDDMITKPMSFEGHSFSWNRSTWWSLDM